MKRVRIRIDRLVLRGFRHADRHAVAAGLRDELGRLLGVPGSAGHLAALESTEHLNAQPVHVEPGGPASEVGLAAARAIGGAIRR